MLDYAEIYAAHPEPYDRLVVREDYEGNILPALRDLCALDGVEVVESGAGTGRLTRLLAPHVRTLHAFDASPAMLAHAAETLQGAPNVTLRVAAHHSLPLPDACADLYLVGWSFCYTFLSPEGDPNASVAHAVEEARRLLRPNGKIIILETFGTGCETPCPPANLAPYFGVLTDLGFHSKWIRTDYRFESRIEAEELITFFFGAEMVAHLDNASQPILPECTALWWRDA
ncbi:MAG: class I SAM-dependent methyltransferase [Chloroflexi bacterium CFX4]|nr:class I SAM-dependent methyltransferase [Chloroflexi bacterium CFX4]MDL1924482.1 class I SAM-dependent methyltransferase [Chloroflexi bacterium CFX3]